MYCIEGDHVIFDDDFNDVLTEDILNEISKYPKIELGLNFNKPIKGTIWFPYKPSLN